MLICYTRWVLKNETELITAVSYSLCIGFKSAPIILGLLRVDGEQLPSICCAAKLEEAFGLHYQPHVD